eukprot:TRINITY_DN98928_c0_g1_i1.p2 TRINITY_DN98928_c0_g1~~TRINITY_DN98928_c0_g1_i1.p2  ORF type:complete len:104 (-),score=0.21 TRINITY_DN98928_c0_g1_i1:4-315(-)
MYYFYTFGKQLMYLQTRLYLFAQPLKKCFDSQFDTPLTVSQKHFSATANWGWCFNWKIWQKLNLSSLDHPCFENKKQNTLINLPTNVKLDYLVLITSSLFTLT